MATAPAPLSDTVAGEPLALLLIVTLPVTEPTVVGLKFTDTVRICEGASVTGVTAPVRVKPAPRGLI